MRSRTCSLLLVAGCVLGPRTPPLEVRYFSPPAAQPARRPEVRQVRLRLGRITPARYLRDAIVHRASAVELARYETLRWSDPPETYLRRAISRTLFDARAVGQAVGGDAPVLELELVAFEEVDHGDRRAGRVEVSYTLRDDRAVIARGTVSVERAAADASIEAVVAAIGLALEASAAELADRVIAALVP